MTRYRTWQGNARRLERREAWPRDRITRDRARQHAQEVRGRWSLEAASDATRRPFVVAVADVVSSEAQPALTAAVQVEPELLKQMSMEEMLLSAV